MDTTADITLKIQIISIVKLYQLDLFFSIVKFAATLHDSAWIQDSKMARSRGFYRLTNRKTPDKHVVVVVASCDDEERRCKCAS